MSGSLMSCKILLAMLIGGLSTVQAACVTDDVSSNCTVEGAEHLSQDASGDRVCGVFIDRLGGALTAADAGIEIGDLTIAIVLDERGTASARVEREEANEVVRYPTVSVDVMDRRLNEQDLEQLADDVARLLSQG